MAIRSSWAPVIGILLVLAGACGFRAGSYEKVASTRLGTIEATPEFRVDHPVLRPGASVWATRVAAGPTEYLAAFELSGDRNAYGRVPYIVVTRVTTGGELVDPIGVQLGEGLSPVVTRAGTHWLVFWYHPTDRKLRCARLLDDGTTPDAGGRLLDVSDLRPAEVAFDGSRVLVLGADGRAVLVEPTCATSNAPVQISTTTTPASVTIYLSVSLAFDGTNYLVGYSTWELGMPDRFMVQRVSPAGIAVGAPIVVFTASWTRDIMDTEGFSGAFGSVASTAAETLVTYTPATWNDTSRVAPRENARYRALRADGTLGDEHVLVSSGAFIEARPAGDGFALFGRKNTGNLGSYNNGDLLFVKVRSNGTEVASFSRSTESYAPDVAALESDLLLAETYDVSRYGGDLSPVSLHTPVTSRTPSQSDPTVASTASGHLFVWSGEDGVFAARVSASGATLDAVPLLIRQSQNNKRTNVATNGRDFAVTSWTDEYTRSVSEIHRVSSGGEVSHIGTLQTGRTFRAPLIASDGSGYLVVWGGYSEARGTELLAARVSEAGELLDTTPLVVDADLANTFSGIALTFDGSAYLVLFQVPSPGEDAIRARRIAPNGTVSEAISTPWTGIAQGVGWGNGRGFLTRTQVDLTQLFGSDLILQGNAFMGASTPLTQTNNGENAPVVWDGKTFWVAWEDNRRGILEPDLYGMPSARDVYVGRFGPSATPLDPGGVRLAEGVAGRSRDPHPVLTHDGQNLLASYAGWDSSFGFGSVRLRWRQLTSADPGDGGGGGEGPGGTGGDAGGGGSGGSTGGSSPRGGSAGATSSTGGSDAGAGAGEAGSPSGGSGDVPTGGRASGTGGASSMSGAPASGEGGAEEPVRVARDNPSDGCSIRVDPRPSHRAPFFGALSVLAFGVASRRRATRRDR